MADIVWFIGAGASAPFGIPTMQGMVTEFRKELEEVGVQDENGLFDDIFTFLSANLGRPVDLESVFTVVDSLIHWSPERIGIASLFQSACVSEGKYSKPSKEVIGSKVVAPPEEFVTPAKKLRKRFEDFVKRKCEITEDVIPRIDKAYGQLFDLVGQAAMVRNQGSNQHVYSDWPIFTTNYDAILECYWVDCARVALNTGFSYNDVAGSKVTVPDNLRNPGLRLFKLHGSVTWLLDPVHGLTEQRVVPKDMSKYTGRKFSGQVIVYPIEEKQLYVEPYMTMFHQLNRELRNTEKWVVVGYSFGDKIVRDMFVRCSTPQIRMALIHTHGKEVKVRLEEEGFEGKIATYTSPFSDNLDPVVFEKLKLWLVR